MTVDKDTASAKVYGKPYRSLSAWGKQQIDHIVEAMADKPPTAFSSNLHDVNARADNERLTGRVRVLEQENDELWQENTELKTENADLRRQLHLPEGDSF